jgi:hypothetical protein
VRIFAQPNGVVLALFRRANKSVNRGTVLVKSTDYGKTFTAAYVDDMQSGTCIMSSYAIAATPAGYVIGLESKGHVRTFRDEGKPTNFREAGDGKYPALAVNAAGDLLVARAVGTGWNKGGTIAWQIFSPDGKPGARGDAKDLPAWSYPAAVALRGGDFLIVY